MKHIIISTKTLILVPLLFVIISLFKIGLNYYDSKERMYDFVQKQSQTLNQFMMVHRTYYQNLYLNKTIPLNQQTLLGLPAFSAFDISEQFSKENHFKITVQTVSDRARNVKNQADSSERKAIAFFNQNREAKEYFQKEKEYFQYATPLFIKQKCLTCHGEKSDAPKFIVQKYNNAYNYKLGELRGIISIKVPKEEIGEYFTAIFIQDVLFDMLIVLIIFSLSFYLIKYFRALATNLQQEVDDKTQALSHNIAFLKSHQIALDESSIVSKSDLKGIITYVNDNFCRITGYTQEEILGKHHNIVRHPENSKEEFAQLWETIQDKKVWKGRLKNRGKTSDYWVDMTILPILDENNNVVEYIAVRSDITQMVEQQTKLDTIANTDSLTGYGNRYKLRQDIKQSSNPALALIDIDGFSQINDFYGHEIGDIVLQTFGDLVAKLIAKDRYKLYHLQGDEFVVFNQDVPKELFVEKMHHLTSQILSSKIEVEGEEFNINVTVALSFELKQILTTADMALKVGKREGKNFTIYSEKISLNDEYENNIKWAKKIKEAIEKDKFVPVFQPIVNNANGKYEKYESLVRLEDEGRLISPYFFLEIAKKSKHYTDITKVMLSKSFETFKDKELEFSINITIEDILNQDIQTLVFATLEKYQSGSRVVFEIVESESIENFEEVTRFIQKIKTYGCKVAIDDFGTGYSNFEYLIKLKANYIKIDGSLIKDIDSNQASQIVVKNIVQFAKDLEMKTIAEFVENESVLNKIKEFGIDYSQGYYFSQPKRELNFK